MTCLGFLLAALAGGGLPAAEPAPFLPAISVQVLQPADLEACAATVAEINAAMKARHGVPLFLRLYAGESTGENKVTCFLLSPAASLVAWQKNDAAFASDAAFDPLRARLQAVARTGGRTLLKGVHFEGTHAPGWLFNTEIVASDEAGLLNAIAESRRVLDAEGFTDARFNVFRVVAGRSDFTHLVSVNTPAAERLAAVLDALAQGPAAARWMQPPAGSVSVVRNGTWRELVR